LPDLFESVPAGEEGSGVRYGAGVLIDQKDPLGEKWGHAGVIPGYSSSMRYYPKYGVAVAFQVNTDSGVSDFVSEMERCLAEIVIKSTSNSGFPAYLGRAAR
jgi:D-alanyl-D-alanine carboxypeptidase